MCTKDMTKDFLRARARAGAVGGFRGGLRGCARGRARLPIEHERPARRLRGRQQLLVQAAVRRVTCGAMGGRGSSGLDRGSSGRGCGARYRRRAAPPPRTAARGTASALRPSPAVVARRAPVVGRRARMFERAWRCSMEWGRVPPPRAAHRAQAATRPCSCLSGARVHAGSTRSIYQRRTHLALREEV